MSFRINYKLKNPNEIAPWGEETKSLSWFGLTDGLLWITAGRDTLYEYADTEQAADFWRSLYTEQGLTPPDDDRLLYPRYNDYQLARFAEDFFGILPWVAQSVPEPLYRSIGSFQAMTDKWLANYEARGDEVFDSFFDNMYEPLAEWYRRRTFDSGHLLGGPDIGFFRCGEKLSMVWQSGTQLPDGGSIWTSPCGVYEMDYDRFVSETAAFYHSFIRDMGDTVALVAATGLEGINIDTALLVREQQLRAETFSGIADILFDHKGSDTDWNMVCELFDLMKSEISD
ncbi:MAG: hypothetical protein E7559_05755 [Ruminococcaceae bacterium]|nr:hypothetical protein [Oscillospiraceae bacterium]